MTTEKDLDKFCTEAEAMFESMLRKFGALTPRERATHAGMLAGFKDGMATMVRYMRDHDMLSAELKGVALSGEDVSCG